MRAAVPGLMGIRGLLTFALVAGAVAGEPSLSHCWFVSGPPVPRAETIFSQAVAHISASS